MNTNLAVETLRAAALGPASCGAREYLRKHNLTADEDSLAACIKAHVKANIGIALHDAKQALAAGMDQAACVTFGATMVLAGIEAAKEASVPPVAEVAQ